MAERLHTRKRGNSLAVWAILVIIAGVVFYGIWAFPNSQHHVTNHPHAITHSTPVGGELLDGVFHPTLGVEAGSTHWHI